MSILGGQGCLSCLLLGQACSPEAAGWVLLACAAGWLKGHIVPALLTLLKAHSRLSPEAIQQYGLHFTTLPYWSLWFLTH